MNEDHLENSEKYNQSSMRVAAAVEQEIPSFVELLSNPDEDPRVRSVITHILAYYPLLDSSLKTTDLLMDLFNTLISLPYTLGTPSLSVSSHVSVSLSSKENPKKRLEKEVLLPNIIITLAVLHQGTDFFVQHNILNKVTLCPNFSRRLSLIRCRWWLNQMLFDLQQRQGQ